ncbi:MAG: ChaN family lipoprotein [Kofleriaceae bacterium]
MDKAKLPELDLANPAHKAWWDELMGSMGGAAGHSTKPEDSPHAEQSPPKEPDKDKPHDKVQMPTADNIYAAQVLWDETMADGGAKWLAANPTGHLVVLAGNGHCHDSAIVGRLKRRGIADVVSLRAVVDEGEGEVARILAKPMNDFVLVLELPPGAKRE